MKRADMIAAGVVVLAAVAGGLFYWKSTQKSAGLAAYNSGNQLAAAPQNTIAPNVTPQLPGAVAGGGNAPDIGKVLAAVPEVIKGVQFFGDLASQFHF